MIAGRQLHENDISLFESKSALTYQVIVVRANVFHHDSILWKHKLICL